MIRTEPRCAYCGVFDPLCGLIDHQAKVAGGYSWDTVCADARACAARVDVYDSAGLILPPQLWAKVERAGDCWRWIGASVPKGHGQIRIDGRLQYVHRVAYEALVGPIPPGLQIDHLCRNPWCVNPAHMEPVTAWENWQRGQSLSRLNAAKTHCVHGHPFDEANTYYRKGDTAKRACRACHCETERQRRRRQDRNDQLALMRTALAATGSHDTDSAVPQDGRGAPLSDMADRRSRCPAT